MRYGSALLHILFFLFRDHPSRASCRVLKKLLICAKLLFVEATNLLRPCTRTTTTTSKLARPNKARPASEANGLHVEAA